MSPASRAAAGPGQGTPVLGITLEDGQRRLFALDVPVVTIGRSVDNVLEIPDPNMSRRHCVIERRDTGEVILTDCNSSNGTRVNQERVISHELRTGDEIEVGSTRMRFAMSRDELDFTVGDPGLAPPPPPPLAPLPGRDGGQDPDLVTRAVTRITSPLLEALPGRRRGDAGRAGAAPAARGGQSDPAKAEAAVLAHERDDLRKLLEIIKRLNQVHDLRKLLEAIIDAAIELMAAERGFLILLADGKMKIEIARNLARGSIQDAASQLSTQVCREVIETGEAVLTTNAQADSRYGRYKSVVGLKLRSILCVPFRIKDETFGTVYLDAAEVGAFSARDIALLEAFSDQAALAIENARLLQLARQQERMEQELRIASQIQRKLLPRKLPDVPGLEAYGWMHSAKEVGGDYYDFVPAADGRSLFFCIGDVSGKGVPAGLVMASARSALRSLVERGVDSTRDIVISLNRLLCEDLDQEMFLSFVLMRYEAGQGTIRYTGAGHENLLVWRGASRKVEVQKTGGMVLGITTRMEDAIEEQELHLAPGDGLVLYTDGVTEQQDEPGEQYQVERLQAAIERHGALRPKEALHAILGEVLRFKGKAAQRDDITLVVLKRRDEASDAGSLADSGETEAFTGFRAEETRP